MILFYSFIFLIPYSPQSKKFFLACFPNKNLFQIPEIKKKIIKNTRSLRKVFLKSWHKAKYIVKNLKKALKRKSNKKRLNFSNKIFKKTPNDLINWYKCIKLAQFCLVCSNEKIFKTEVKRISLEFHRHELRSWYR